MATTPRRTPGHQMFINLLFSFYIHCGKHPKDELAAAAGQVGDRYSDYRSGDAPGLSGINLYKILRGHHRTLPTSRQLSVIVLALQYLAYHAHIRDHDPGCATLPGWQALLSQAETMDRHQRAGGQFVSAAAHDVDQPLQLPMPAPAAPAPPPVRAAQITPPAVEVTPIELHELVALGHYARELAMRAADADPRAFYELAVVLGTAAAPYNQRAAVFAMAAAAAVPGPSPASDLLDADAAINSEEAARHARVLAYSAAGYDNHDAARVFDYCADRVGNPSLHVQAPQLHD